MRFKDFSSQYQLLLQEGTPYKDFLDYVAAELAKEKPFDGSVQHLAGAAKLVTGLKMLAKQVLDKPDAPGAGTLSNAMKALKPSVEQEEELRNAIYKAAEGEELLKTVFAGMRASDKSGAIAFVNGLAKDMAKAQIRVKPGTATPAKAPGKTTTGGKETGASAPPA